MSDNVRDRIEQIVLAALGAAIPVAIAAWQLPGWIAAHPDLAAVIRDTCSALLGS